MSDKIKAWGCIECGKNRPCTTETYESIRPLLCPHQKIMSIGGWNKGNWKPKSNIPDIPKVPPIPKKIKTWGCNTCDDGPCSVSRYERDLNGIPQMKCGDIKMVLFPLVKIPSKDINPEKEKKDEKIKERFGSKSAPLEKFEQGTENTGHKTPNCEVCRWRVNNIKSEIKDFDQLNKALNDYSSCSAQAFRSVDKCYDNDNCRALFESKEKPVEITEASEAEIKGILRWVDSKSVITKLAKLPAHQQVELKSEIIFHLNEFMKTATFEDLNLLNYSPGISTGLHLSAEILVIFGAYGANFRDIK